MFHEKDHEERYNKVGKADCMYSKPGGDVEKLPESLGATAAAPSARTTKHNADSMLESIPVSRNRLYML